MKTDKVARAKDRISLISTNIAIKNMMMEKMAKKKRKMAIKER